MKTLSTTFLVAAALVFAVPVAAQDETPADTTAEAQEPGEAPAAEAADATVEGEAAEQPDHDWEFALSPTDRAAGASGVVMVSDADGSSAFLVETAGLPVVDSLDQEGRDVNVYTVWVVPSKDRVPESTLAGVLEIDPETGDGLLEATTDLASFGVIVTATENGAPERIGGVPVLTGIPVQPQTTPDAGEAPAAEPEAEVADPPAEVNEPPAPGDQPDTEDPETEPEPAPEPETPETPETPSGR